MTLLLFGGPVSVNALTVALAQRRGDGDDRFVFSSPATRGVDGDQVCVELMEQAHEWVTWIWEPLREDGHALRRDVA